MTPNVGIQKRSDPERRDRFSAVRLWKSAGRVKDTERKSRPTAGTAQSRHEKHSVKSNRMKTDTLTAVGSSALLGRRDRLTVVVELREGGQERFLAKCQLIEAKVLRMCQHDTRERTWR